jgi:hypothetical protein
MIKQIKKTKNLLVVMLLLCLCGSFFYVSNVHAEAILICSSEGAAQVKGSACYDIAVACPSSTGFVATLCSDINGICNSTTSSSDTVKEACDDNTISASCLSSNYSAVLGYTCLDLSSICSSSPSSSVVCEGYTASCSSSSASTDAACSSSGGPSSQSTYACYDSYTGWTYICGDAARAIPAIAKTNTYSVAPVLNANLQPNPTAVINGVTEYSFDPSNCYAVQLATYTPSGGNSTTGLAWVAQSSSDCSSNTAFATTTADSDGDLPLPDIATASNGSLDACQKKNCIVSSYINPLIRFLNILVTVVAVIAIVIGGIQYSSSRDNPESLKSARKHITNALLGLICYFLLFAFLSFLIPGGI